MWKYFVITVVVLLLFGCDSRYEEKSKPNIKPTKPPLNFVEVDNEILRMQAPYSNACRIVDTKYGYILYITRQGGITAVPIK